MGNIFKDIIQNHLVNFGQSRSMWPFFWFLQNCYFVGGSIFRQLAIGYQHFYTQMIYNVCSSRSHVLLEKFDKFCHWQSIVFENHWRVVLCFSESSCACVTSKLCVSLILLILTFGVECVVLARGRKCAPLKWPTALLPCSMGSKVSWVTAASVWLCFYLELYVV